ncbi:acyl-CoA thioesterase [Streptodolium elevatio]
MESTSPASVVIERRVEWVDTDAAGHHHHSAVLRWAEAAETVLLRRLGLEELYGSIPRVHYEADYRARLWFGETVRVELRVDKVGTTSLHYVFEVYGREGLAAAGRMSIARAAADSPTAAPWSEAQSALFAGAGPQEPERL